MCYDYVHLDNLSYISAYRTWGVCVGVGGWGVGGGGGHVKIKKKLCAKYIAI